MTRKYYSEGNPYERKYALAVTEQTYQRNITDAVSNMIMRQMVQRFRQQDDPNTLPQRYGRNKNLALKSMVVAFLIMIITSIGGNQCPS